MVKLISFFAWVARKLTEQKGMCVYLDSKTIPGFHFLFLSLISSSTYFSFHLFSGHLPFSTQRGGTRCAEAGAQAYVHQLLLGVILFGAVFPMAVGLVDDHFGLLLALIPVQVFFEVSQLLLVKKYRSM